WVETYTLRDLDASPLRQYRVDGGNGAGHWSIHRDYVWRGATLLAAVRNVGLQVVPETTHFLHPDHLGSPRLITDETGNTVAQHVYFPFGEEATPPSTDEVLKFTGHERDPLGAGTTDDLDYIHARYYSPHLGRFLSVDPANRYEPTKKPQAWNRYAYGHGNPVLKIDPDGKDALAVTYVGYRVGTPFGRRALGHSGITIVKSGRTKYYEFGRYGSGGGGRVRIRGPLPDLQLGKNGLPTKASLKTYLHALTKVAGQNKPVQGAYFVNDQADAMLGFATARESDPSKQGAYSATGNNCATFCEDVLEAGGEDLDVSMINSPANVMQELQDVADFSVSYDPSTGELTVTCEQDSACPE
ncbi:MAG: RHS repeat-associated core domain-containing protein, partial [Acidobacteriota bacterium]